MAVRPEFHRQGVGRALLSHLEIEAAARGGLWLHVKTLAPSHPDPFYARTRKFYEAMGFAPLFESETQWGPENPALVLVKRL
jgi:GNAT superfamily N-acetyltransferase